MLVYWKRYRWKCFLSVLVCMYFLSLKNVFPTNVVNNRDYLLPSLKLDILSTQSIHQSLYEILDSEEVTEKIWDGREIFGMALISLKEGDLSNAEGLFLRALREYGRLKDYSVFYLSRVLAAQGKFRESVIALKDLIKHYPDSSLTYRAYKNLANIYFVLNNYQAAIDNYLECLKYSSEDEILIKYQIGIAKMQLKEWAAARDSFRDILIKAPQSPYSRAVIDYLDILKTEHNISFPTFSFEELVEKGKIQMEKKFYLEASETYKTIMERFPKNKDIDSIEYKFAVCLMRINKAEEGIKILESLGTPDAMLLLGKTYWNRHESPKAEKLFNQYLEKFKKGPNRDKVIYYLGRIAEEAKEYERARGIYSQIIDKVPNGEFEKNALWRIGWGYYSAGEYKKAADFFSEWAGRFSYYDTVDKHQFYYWQAMSLGKMKKDDCAKKIYMKILDDPYWSYYSGCARMRVSGMIGADTKDLFMKKNISFKSIENIKRKERKILNEIKELTLFELHKEVKDKIAYYLNKGGYSIGFCYQLAILAYMNMQYDLSIKCASKFYYRIKSSDMTLEDEAMFFPLAYKDRIGELSRQYNLNPWVLISLIRQESFFDPKSLSIAKAYGLMQIIPPLGYRLAKDLMPSDYFEPEKMYDPNINLDFGFYHFRELLDKFDQDIIYAIAAYNAGSGAVSRWRERFNGCEIDEFIENIPFGETRNYVKRILKNCWMYYRIYGQKIKLTKR
ncbi:MAG: transglycosylase SLT domain-containing protein [bacterium]